MLVLKHPSVSYFTQPFCLFVLFIYWQSSFVNSKFQNCFIIFSFFILLSFLFSFFSMLLPICLFLFLFFLTPLSLLSSLLLQKGESPKCIYTCNSSPTDSALLAYSFYYYFYYLWIGVSMWYSRSLKFATPLHWKRGITGPCNSLQDQGLPLRWNLHKSKYLRILQNQIYS